MLGWEILIISGSRNGGWAPSTQLLAHTFGNKQRTNGMAQTEIAENRVFAQQPIGAIQWLFDVAQTDGSTAKKNDVNGFVEPLGALNS